MILSSSLTKKLLAFTLLFLSLGVFAQERFALVIGNADYQVSPLKNALNDAQDITQALEALDFKVTLIENADKRTMKEAIYNFGQILNKDTVGLFYYAGHAIQFQGENYLIPINALPEIKKDWHLEDEAVRAQRVSKNMEESESKLNFIFLDACRNNPLPADSRGIVQGLTRSKGAEGSLIAFSTSPGRTAQDGEGRNSPYTKSLLQFINTPNQPVELMLKDVKEAVANNTNGDQLPWYESSITGNFCFNTTSEGCAEFVQVIYDPYLEGIYDIEIIEFDNGDQYVGQVKNGLMHGKGVLTETSGIKYKGEFINGFKHGKGSIVFLNGNKYEGFFYEGQKDDLGLSSFINGATVRSRWDKGKQIFIQEDSFFDGTLDEWDCYSGNGTRYETTGLSIQATYKLCQVVSETAIITLPSGDKYTGLSEDLNGTGVFVNSVGEKLEGNFNYGLLNGIGTKTWANGDIYVGDFKDGYMHGQGTKTLSHGQIRKGEFKFDRLNGFGTQTFIDGSIHEGEWLNGQAFGHGVLITSGENGYKYEGTWKFDFKNGKGIQIGKDYSYEGGFEDDDFSGYGIYSDDYVTYDGELKGNLFNGIGKATYLTTGVTYEGEFLEEEFHGNGIYTWPDGEKYEGEFRNGQFQGQGIITYANGSIFSGEFQDNLFHGKGTLTYSDGTKYVGEFKDDLFNGEGVITYSDGTKYVGEFKDDLINGTGVLTNRDGTKFTGEFLDNYATEAIFTDLDKNEFKQVWDKEKRISSEQILN